MDVLKLSSPATREYWEIPVLYEDDQLLALNKPSRLLTSPDRYDPERPNLMKLLHRDIARGAGWARQRQLTYLANAHRLDFETTGVILLAKNKPTLVALANQFGSEKPVKVYVALVQGVPAESAFTIDLKLAPHPARPEVIRVDQKRGKKARTRFEILEKFSGFALLRCEPATGRTHQIRVHLQASGCPVVGDLLYGGRPLLLSTLKPHYRLKPNATERPLLQSVSLHAAELRLVRPADGQPIQIQAPWPKDLTVAIKYLRRYAQPSPGPSPSAPIEPSSISDQQSPSAL
jgi:RluA family pseudouridine synthase